MNNLLKIILIFIFITNCSLHKNSKFWSETEKITVIKSEKKEQKEPKLEKRAIEDCHRIFLIKMCKKVKNSKIEEVLANNEIIVSEFNTNLKISLYSKLINKSFLNNFDNNNGRINFKGTLQNIKKYKFSKIKDFHQYDPKISFYNNDIIFFDNRGSVLRFNSNTDLVWKKNNYTKSEKKQNPILFFANNKKTLIIADNISKYYALDIDTGETLWIKNNSAPFNSEIKIYKDKFFVIDFENILRAYSISEGNEIWNIKTANTLIRSQKKLSLVIIDGKIYFNNSSGDISSVNIETGELLWQTPTQSNLILEESFYLKTSDIIADNDTIFFSNNLNQFFSLDIETGTLNWQQKISSNLKPTLIDNYIFTVNLDGYLFIIEKNSGNILRITDSFKNFKFKKRNKIKATGFIVGNDNVYLTTNHGRLLVLDVMTGKVINVMKINNTKIARPSVLNQNMFIISDNSIIKLD